MAFLRFDSRPATTVASDRPRKSHVDTPRQQQRGRSGDTSALRRLVRVGVDLHEGGEGNTGSRVQHVSARTRRYHLSGLRTTYR